MVGVRRYRSTKRYHREWRITEGRIDTIGPEPGRAHNGRVVGHNNASRWHMMVSVRLSMAWSMARVQYSHRHGTAWSAPVPGQAAWNSNGMSRMRWRQEGEVERWHCRR